MLYEVSAYSQQRLLVTKTFQNLNEAMLSFHMWSVALVGMATTVTLWEAAAKRWPECGQDYSTRRQLAEATIPLPLIEPSDIPMEPTPDDYPAF